MDRTHGSHRSPRISWTARIDWTYGTSRCRRACGSSWRNRSAGSPRSHGNLHLPEHRSYWTHWSTRCHRNNWTHGSDRSIGADGSHWTDGSWIYWSKWTEWSHGSDRPHGCRWPPRPYWPEWKNRSSGTDGSHGTYWSHSENSLQPCSWLWRG